MEEGERKAWKVAIERSRFARAEVMPVRLKAVAKSTDRQAANSATWLARSREHTNFTYSLTDLNMGQLERLVAGASDASSAEVRTHVRELLDDIGHELREYQAVAPRLAAGALVASDKAHVLPVLQEWAEENGRRFAFFQDRPDGHWYSGAGVGVSLESNS